MVRRNFFKDLRDIEFSRTHGELTSLGESAFSDLVSFVELCPFSKSKNSKFICQNWRLNANSLSSVWMRRTGKEKTESAFRGQISELSSLLYSMFPMFGVELFVSDIESDTDKEALIELRSVIMAMQDSPCFPEDIFITEVCNYLDSMTVNAEYTPADCEDIVAFLKPYMKSEVYASLDEADMDKFKYIMSTLSEPLTKVHGGKPNMDKLRILRMFGLVESGTPSVRSDSVESETVYIEVPEKIPYTLSVTKSLSDLLTSSANRTLTTEETIAWTEASEKKREAEKTRIANVLYAMTEGGFAEFLSRVNPLAIQEVLDGNYSFSSGRTPVGFRKG